MSDHLRLFVAIRVPDAIKNSLQKVQTELQGVVPEGSVRWTLRDQIHLTLRFFGNATNEDLDELKKVMQNACEGIAVFRLQAYGLGVFPEKRFPRVIWAAVRDDQNQLGASQQKICAATAQFGEKPDDTPFSGHLTLGRVKEIRSHDPDALRRFVAGEATRPYGEWPVDEVELLRSELGSAGAKHSVIATYSLRH